jgi:hypothetical protein
MFAELFCWRALAITTQNSVHTAMNIAESALCASDLIEHYRYCSHNSIHPHYKILQYLILIRIGLLQDRGQTDAPPVTGAHAAMWALTGHITLEGIVQGGD